jgi:hypothetical protein
VLLGAGALSKFRDEAVARSEALVPLAAGGTYADVRVGLLTFNAGTIVFSEDENAGGAAKTIAATGSYAVASNGRVTVNTNGGNGGCADCVGGGLTYYYLVGTNQGFVSDFTTGGTSGQFEPQTAVAPAASTLSGVYSAGSLLPLSQSVTDVAASLNASGTGTDTGTLDENAAGTLTPDVALTGTYTVAANGRGTLTGIGSGNVVMYVVSSTKAVLLDVGATVAVVDEAVHQ